MEEAVVDSKRAGGWRAGGQHRNRNILFYGRRLSPSPSYHPTRPGKIIGKLYENDSGICWSFSDPFLVNIIMRIAKKLRRIILLHYCWLSLWENPETPQFHDSRIPGCVHGPQNQLFFNFGDTNRLQIIQEKNKSFLFFGKFENL